MSRVIAALLAISISIQVRASENWHQQVANDFASPVTTPARRIFWTGAALTTVVAVFRNQISEPLQDEVTRTRPLGNFASNMGKAGQALQPNIAYALGMILNYWATHEYVSRDRANLMFRASAYAQLVTTMIKNTIREPRPGGFEDKRSFPSGHATGAFSFASVVASEHEWYWGGLAYTYATLVAYSRMNDNRHFLHDVLGGATIGASYGWGLYYRAHHKEPAQVASMLMLLPSEKLDGALVAYSRAF
jgi:membrane-associated phospholipid phosphatase